MRTSAEQIRRFRYAVALSVAVHLIALFGTWPVLRESLQEPVVPPPLVTRIVELAPAEPAPPTEERKPPPPPREVKKREPAPSPPPAPSAEAPPVPAPEPAEPPPVASAPP